MAPRYDTISFLSDYGTSDEFVGVVKSVLRSFAPHAAVIDITHDIAPHDVRAGALCLARAAQYLAPGVVIAVVDPGVGTERRAVAVEVGDGDSVLVGPDNGLLAPAVALVGGASRAVTLTNPDLRLPAAGATFDGRDLFAPAAAHLCNGVPLEHLGEEIDPALLRPGVMPLTRLDDGAVVAEVLWVDRFGNVQLNVDPEEVAAFGDRIGLEWGEQSRTGTLARAYGDLGPGEIGLVVDSYGLLSIALDRRSAAAELGLAAGSQVALRLLPGDEAEGSARDAVPIALRSRTAATKGDA